MLFGFGGSCWPGAGAGDGLVPGWQQDGDGAAFGLAVAWTSGGEASPFVGTADGSSHSASVGSSDGLSQYGVRFGFGSSGLRTPAFGLPNISRLQS